MRRGREVEVLLARRSLGTEPQFAAVTSAADSNVYKEQVRDAMRLQENLDVAGWQLPEAAKALRSRTAAQKLVYEEGLARTLNGAAISARMLPHEQHGFLALFTKAQLEQGMKGALLSQAQAAVFPKQLGNTEKWIFINQLVHAMNVDAGGPGPVPPRRDLSAFFGVAARLAGDDLVRAFYDERDRLPFERLELEQFWQLKHDPTVTGLVVRDGAMVLSSFVVADLGEGAAVPVSAEDVIVSALSVLDSDAVKREEAVELERPKKHVQFDLSDREQSDIDLAVRHSLGDAFKYAAGAPAVVEPFAEVALSPAEIVLRFATYFSFDAEFLTSRDCALNSDAFRVADAETKAKHDQLRLDYRERHWQAVRYPSLLTSKDAGGAMFQRALMVAEAAYKKVLVEILSSKEQAEMVNTSGAVVPFHRSAVMKEVLVQTHKDLKVQTKVTAKSAVVKPGKAPLASGGIRWNRGRGRFNDVSPRNGGSGGGGGRGRGRGLQTDTPGGGGGRGVDTRVCFQCNRPGHVAANCFSRKKDPFDAKPASVPPGGK